MNLPRKGVIQITMIKEWWCHLPTFLFTKYCKIKGIDTNKR